MTNMTEDNISVSALKIAYVAVKSQRTYADLNDLWSTGLADRETYVSTEKLLARLLEARKIRT